MGLIVLSLAASHNHVLKQFGNLEMVLIELHILLIYNISDSMWAKRENKAAFSWRLLSCVPHSFQLIFIIKMPNFPMIELKIANSSL